MNFLNWNRTRSQDAGLQTATAPIAPHLQLGRHGEELARQHLEQAGYRIVAANVKLPVGRNTRDVVIEAEIDLIGYDRDVLCFIEVKTRSSDDFAAPQANVNLRKQRQIARAARAYRRMMGVANAAYRYDVVTVITSGAVSGRSKPLLELLKGFWNDERFRKHQWSDGYWD
jgi:putative endonuclease